MYLGNEIVPVSSSSARNLGFMCDSDLCFPDLVNPVSESCHFHIRDIYRIRSSYNILPLLSAATGLANSIVIRELDYCNSLYGLHKQISTNSTHSSLVGTSHYKTSTESTQSYANIHKKENLSLCLLPVPSLKHTSSNLFFLPMLILIPWTI